MVAFEATPTGGKVHISLTLAMLINNVEVHEKKGRLFGNLPSLP